MTSSSHQFQSTAIHFPHGHHARLVAPPRDSSVSDVVKALNLTPPAALLLILGGASGLDDALKPRLLQFFSRGLACAAADTGATIMDGGTASGIMAIMGQGVSEQGHKSPLLGVAPVGKVTYPDGPEPSGGSDTAPLEPNHTHFVLVDSDQWGGETETFFEIADALAGPQTLVTAILVNGGPVAHDEVLRTVRRGWPLVVLSGTGRLADEIASHTAKDPDAINDPVLAEIIADGDLTLFPLDGKVKDFQHLIHQRLTPDSSLKQAWERYNLYDEAANSQQVSFKNNQVLILALGVIVTVLALANSFFFPGAQRPQVSPATLKVLKESKVKPEILTALQQSQVTPEIIEELKKTEPKVNPEILASVQDTWERIKDWQAKQAQTQPFWRAIMVILRYAIIIIPILTAMFLAISNRFKWGQKWILLRAGAEAVKRECFRYWTGAGTYGPSQTKEISRQERLAQEVKNITDRLKQTEITQTSLAPSPQPVILPLPPAGLKKAWDGFSLLPPEAYLKLRLEDQLNWYIKKTGVLEKQLRCRHITIYFLGGLGTLLAAIGGGIELWVAATTSLAAAVTSYLGVTQVEHNLVKYNQTAIDLENTRAWWTALSPTGKEDPKNIDRLVDDTEIILQGELTGWVKQMEEAQAAEKERQTRMQPEMKEMMEKFAGQMEKIEAILATLKEKPGQGQGGVGAGQVPEKPPEPVAAPPKTEEPKTPPG